MFLRIIIILFLLLSFTPNAYAVCGDKVIDEGETCDDGNIIGGDGCSDTCQIEECGNGVVDVGETCDDGNTDNNDGCSSLCVGEPHLLFIEKVDNSGGEKGEVIRCVPDLIKHKPNANELKNFHVIKVTMTPEKCSDLVSPEFESVTVDGWTYDDYIGERALKLNIDNMNIDAPEKVFTKSELDSNIIDKSAISP